MEEINIDRIGINGNKAKLILPDGYEFKTEGKEVYVVKKKPQYPKTYEECCKVLEIEGNSLLINTKNITDYERDLGNLMGQLYRLIICRDAYWKIALDLREKRKGKAIHYVICSTLLGEVVKDTMPNCIANYLLDFLTAEMRDAFYVNFKDLIEQCKELL